MRRRVSRAMFETLKPHLQAPSVTTEMAEAAALEAGVSARTWLKWLARARAHPALRPDARRLRSDRGASRLDPWVEAMMSPFVRRWLERDLPTQVAAYAAFCEAITGTPAWDSTEALPSFGTFRERCARAKACAPKKTPRRRAIRR